MTGQLQSNEDFYAVIPAGGMGTRLWPVSTSEKPKFLQSILNNNESLLQSTWERLKSLVPVERILIVTGLSYRDEVLQQIPDLLPNNLILEPSPRDSGAAIGLAAAVIHKRNPNAIIGSFHADHVIRGLSSFTLAVTQSVISAEAGYLSVIGIHPTRAATGFGYIKTAGPQPKIREGVGFSVERFVEKPDLDTARSYLQSGEYFWNAGIFIAKTELILEAFKKNSPDLHRCLLELAEVFGTETCEAEFDRIWQAVERIAFEYPVAIPLAEEGKLVVIPGHFFWEDVGDFAAIHRMFTGGNSKALATIGDKDSIIAQDSSGLVIRRSDRIIAVTGVSQIVVVDTPDALLVTSLSNVQGVKQIVAELDKREYNPLNTN